MELSDFLIDKMPFYKDNDYFIYESPTHFNLRMFPYKEIFLDDVPS